MRVIWSSGLGCSLAVKQKINTHGNHSMGDSPHMSFQSQNYTPVYNTPYAGLAGSAGIAGSAGSAGSAGFAGATRRSCKVLSGSGVKSWMPSAISLNMGSCSHDAIACQTTIFVVQQVLHTVRLRSCKVPMLDNPDTRAILQNTGVLSSRTERLCLHAQTHHPETEEKSPRTSWPVIGRKSLISCGLMCRKMARAFNTIDRPGGVANCAATLLGVTNNQTRRQLYSYNWLVGCASQYTR